VARVRAVLRRTASASEELPDVNVGNLTVSFARHEVTRDGNRLDLTPTEFGLLGLFVRNPFRAFSRLQLVEEVFGLDYAGMERTIDVHVMNLRRKVEADAAHPTYIKTVFGVGYRFEAEPDVR
jgi:DNA-binding response OmpR family regulator